MQNQGGGTTNLRTVTADGMSAGINSDTLIPTGCPVNRDQTQRVTSILSAGNNTSTNQAHINDVEEERIRQEERSLDEKKLKLYLEATKVHGAQDGDRKFSDYWDSLCRYLSTGDSVRSDCDGASHGVEAILKAFLTSKKLRKLHNIYVKAVMKQCLQTRASEDRIGDHVPLQWRKKVKKITPMQNPCSSLHTFGNGFDHIFHPIRQEFSVQSSAFQNCGSSAIMSDRSSQLKISALESNHYQSPRLPGMLEIGHLSQQATDPDGLPLSKSAQWVAVIAIREFLANIVQKTMTHFEAKDVTSCGSRKRRRISNYDLSQVMDDAVSHNQQFPFPASSRVAWERFTLNSKTALANPSNIDLDHYQNTINNLMEETTAQSIEKKRKSRSRPVSAAGRPRLGKGKDLMAMRARHTKPQARPTVPTTEEDVDLKSVQSQQNPSLPSDRSATSQFRDMLNPSPSTYTDPFNSTASRRSPAASTQNTLRMLQRESFGNNSVSGGRSGVDSSITRNISPLIPWSQGESKSLSTLDTTRTHSAGSAAVKINGFDVEVLHARPQSTSSTVSRRPSSSGSGARRGRGAKDLKRMLARNRTK